MASGQAAGLWRGARRLPTVLRRRHRRRLGGRMADPHRTGSIRGCGGRERGGDRAQECRRGGRLARLPGTRAHQPKAVRPLGLAHFRDDLEPVAHPLLRVAPGRVAHPLGLRRPSDRLRPHDSSHHDLLGTLVHRASGPQRQHLPGLIAHSIANLSQIPLSKGGLPITPGWELLVSPLVGVIPNAIILAAGLGLWARRTGRLRGRSR